ncbi:hypothetical protein [Desulfovermiculus halophilus]|uniref:hypothetical protein n=1 Tax=Desulfovermiculus halophilus TaxID=339722 RepID=UPI00047F6DA7|nr:hypothetical protein [Desulfovermiculus halophilus]
MVDDTYKILAGEIQSLFEERFGKFSVEDFDKVAEIIRGKCKRSNARNADKSYENLPEEEKDQIDFMMGL